ncbi:MAG: aspartate-semialdehyde dehydrogenase [Bacillota bacterium]|nr:aspartate-semialdehyde dehydrogenase [Bacillota bacterium]
MKEWKVGVVGALGLVGGVLLRVLEERSLPVGELRPFTSSRTAGERVTFRGKDMAAQTLAEDAVADLDVAFFAIGDDISREWAPRFREAGVLVIDKSNAFRMEEGVPLVVPEINGEELGPPFPSLVASPNCTTIELAMVLHPLQKAAGLRSVAVATYQSVSGSGQKGLEVLERESRGAPGESPYLHPIHHNVLPHCDGFLPDGSTKEERKLRDETRKILGLPHLPVMALAVRVPVPVGHGVAAFVELEKELTAAEAREVLGTSPGLLVWDDPQQGLYPTPREVAGRDEVAVGRIRQDPERKNLLSFFVAADNLRKGAATNAVQIWEGLMARGWRGR